MAAAILLFLVLRQMTGSLWRSAFVAAVFAIHPLRAESVAWISERKDVLSGFFFMLTLGAYLRYVRRPFSAGHYAVAALLFTLGLLSKSMLVTLPFVLLLLDFWPLKRFQPLETKKTIGRLILEKIPLLLLAAVFCGITIWAQRGAISSFTAQPVPWRFWNAFCSYAIYIKQTIFPSGLALLYPHQGTELPLWEIGISIALLTGISWGVFAGRKKYPYLITGWLWYLGMLVPVIGIMQVGPQAHADRYTYLPQIGLMIMSVWLTADWCTSLRYRRAVLSTAAAVVLTVLAVTAHRQTRYWCNSISLWTHTLACTDGNCIAHNNLGGLLGQKGQLEKAILHFEKAIEIRPNFADAHYNLGVILGSQGRFDKAIPYLENALKINPNDATGHCTLGAVFSKQRKFDKALLHFEKALAINPNSAEVQNDLAWLLATCPDAALRDGKRAVELAHAADLLSGGNRTAVLNTLAAAYAEAGKYPEAVATAHRALNAAAGQASAAEGIRMRLRLYEAGAPYHEAEKGQ